MKWILVLIIVMANAAGDLSNSKGMKRHGEVADFRPEGILKLGASLARNAYVLFGFAMMAVAFIAQMSLLSIADLSFAVPASASSYVVETLLAKLILREHITSPRWLGAGLVACGVAMLQL